MKDPLFKGWIQSFQVKRQQYFGGVFVGNHIHKALKVLSVSYESP